MDQETQHFQNSYKLERRQKKPKFHKTGLKLSKAEKLKKLHSDPHKIFFSKKYDCKNQLRGNAKFYHQTLMNKQDVNRFFNAEPSHLHIRDQII